MTSFHSILAAFMPGVAETLLVRACLNREGAWNAFLQIEPDPEAFARRDNRGFKQLLPLLAYTLETTDRLTTDPFRGPLRLAIMREELRWNTFRSSAQAVLSLLSDAGFVPLVTGGTALAETVYAAPILRHCHDLDVLVDAADLPRINALFTASTILDPAIAPSGPFFRYTTGLEVRLHTTLTRVPHNFRTVDEVQAVARPAEICGVPALVPSTADLLLQILGNAVGSRPGRWTADAATLLHRYPDLDWNVVTDAVRGGNAAAQIAAMAHYLADTLDAPVPVAVLTDLDRQAAASGALAHETAAAVLRPSARTAVRVAASTIAPIRDRLRLVQSTLFPSAAFQRSVEAPPPTLRYHLQRAVRVVRAMQMPVSTR